MAIPFELDNYGAFWNWAVSVGTFDMTYASDNQLSTMTVPGGSVTSVSRYEQPSPFDFYNRRQQAADSPLTYASDASDLRSRPTSTSPPTRHRTPTPTPMTQQDVSHLRSRLRGLLLLLRRLRQPGLKDHWPGHDHLHLHRLCRLASDSDGNAYAYDDCGNLTGISGGPARRPPTPTTPCPR